MKKIFLLFLLSHTLLFTQTNSPIINQIIVRDTSGSIQTRSINTPFWSPILPSMSITEKSFIRLNSLDSIITLSFPDGSLLKIIGIGSIFLDDISKANANIYNNKILLISGRWTYQSNPLYKSRLIMNTDTTTSIIENGTGSGYFYNGTNEFVLKKGRGIISYRQSNVNALVLDEKQYVNFNVYDGFFYPKLATDDILNQYFFFEPIKQKTVSNTNQTNLHLFDTNSLTNTILTNSNTNIATNIISYNELNLLYYIPHTLKSQDMSEQTIFSSYQKFSKNELTQNHLNLDYLDSLTDLQFPTKKNTINNVGIKQVEKQVEKIKKQLKKRSTPKNINKNINPNLLKSIDVNDFAIKKTPAKKEIKKIVTPTKKVQPKRQRAVVKPIKKPVKPKKKVAPKVKKEKKNIDINELVQSLGKKITEEKALEEEEEKALEEEEAPVKEPSINIIKSVKIPEITRESDINRIEAVEDIESEPEAEEEIDLSTLTPEERRKLGHNAPDYYYRRDIETDKYKKSDTFNPHNENDILNSDFNSIMFTI